MADFPPPRNGLSLQVALTVILAAVSSLFGLLASREPLGLRFTIYILVAALALFPVPFLVYWLYSLNRASYNLDRNKLTLSWGLRTEQIPVSDVEWVRPLSVLKTRLSLPFFRLPGAILGMRNHRELGTVEFLASDRKSLLLVATAKQVFAISPQDPNGFMQAIQHSIEMGSLSPVPSQSIHLSFAIIQAWDSLLARYSWLVGLFLNIGLLAWVSLMIPSLGHISLGFLPNGMPGEAVPGAGLILLPIVSIFFYISGWVTGLIFYPRPDRQVLAQVIWASGAFTSLLFLIAVMFIVTSPA
jgi:hypothetical protein